MSPPRVSVVMPVHNAAAWVGSSIGSLLGQDLDGLEVVVVDDGSTDGSADAVQAVADDRVRLVRQANTGIVGALAEALRHTTAPVVARQDADDLSLPGRLSAQLAVLADPDVVACGCTYDVVDPEDRVLSTIAPPPDDVGIRRRMLVRNPYAGGSLMVRRAALDRIGGFSSAFRSAEDYEVLVRLAAVGRLGSATALSYAWRVHDTNTSTQVRDLELATDRRIKDDVWRQEPPAALGRRELLAMWQRCSDSDPDTGPVIAAQLLRNELLLAGALMRRGRRRQAAAALAVVAGLPRAATGPVARDVPARLREVRRHRSR